MGVNPAVAGLLGGMGGGIAQAYATMGKNYISENEYSGMFNITLPTRFLHMYEDRRNYPS